MMWSTLDLILASSSSAISKTLLQNSSMSTWTLHGQSCLQASNLTSASSWWVYWSISSMSSVFRQMLMSSFLPWVFYLEGIFFLFYLPLGMYIFNYWEMNESEWINLGSLILLLTELFNSEVRNVLTMCNQGSSGSWNKDIIMKSMSSLDWQLKRMKNVWRWFFNKNIQT